MILFYSNSFWHIVIQYMCTKINEEVLLGHTFLAITFIKNEIYDSGKYRIEIDCDNLDSSISIRLECLK